MALETNSGQGCSQSHLNLPAHTRCRHITPTVSLGRPTTVSPQQLLTLLNVLSLKALWFGFQVTTISWFSYFFLSKSSPLFYADSCYYTYHSALVILRITASSSLHTLSG